MKIIEKKFVCRVLQDRQCFQSEQIVFRLGFGDEKEIRETAGGNESWMDSARKGTVIYFADRLNKTNSNIIGCSKLSLLIDLLTLTQQR